MITPSITQERLRSIVRYDEATGEFTWTVTRSSKAKAGCRAGGVYASTGYRMIKVDYADISEHRLAWFYVHGEWPEHQIDHINGDRTDNRIANLRDVPQTLNSQNQRRPHADKKSCQLLGATWDKYWGNWKAQLRLNKRTIYIGRFKTAEEAHEAYLVAKRRLHAGCTL